MSSPLSRFKVLDLTRVRAGPTAARQFADWGADVLMIETKESSPSGAPRAGSDFQNLHRNKRSMALDLKSEEGRAILYRLVEQADVVLENFRPDVKRRLKIDYATLSAINPRLVYGSISGFGEEGPYRDRPGVDQIAQGMGGLMSITGLPGQGPVRAGVAVADTASGLYCALGVMTALLERESTGRGQWVRTSLLQAQIALLDFQAARWLVDGVVPKQEGNDHPTSAAMGVFPAKDGDFNLAVIGEPMYRRLCEALGAPHLREEARFGTVALRLENRVALSAAIAAITRTRTRAEWAKIFTENEIGWGPINTIDQVFADPQVRHLQMARTIEDAAKGPIIVVGQPITMSRGEARFETRAPDRGQHTDEVLAALGYGDGEIADLRRRGIV